MARTIRTLIVSLVLTIVAAASVTGLELRFYPSKTIYAYENRGEGTPADLYTAVIQNLAVVEQRDERVELQRIRIDILRAGSLSSSRIVDAEALAKAAATMHAYQQQGVLEQYDFQFHLSRYLAGLSMAEDRNLRQGSAIVLSRLALLWSGAADEIRVTAEAVSSTGAEVTADASLDVLHHVSENDYHFPLAGRLLVAAAPSLHSHHRWSPVQEFALDVVMVGEGGLTHSGDGSRLEQFFVYGHPVFSIGDGTVVAASDGATESSSNLKQPDESAQAYFQRTMAYQQQLLAKGFAAILGNYVVIRHAGGEFSHYAHLRNGSVEVTTGDRVRRGQQIGKVGHSGNSTEPHLHFHLADGEDTVSSRSLPLAFENITLYPADDGSVRHLHTGQMVDAKRQQQQ